MPKEILGDLRFVFDADLCEPRTLFVDLGIEPVTLDPPETLPGGNVVVIDPGGSSDLWTLGELLDNPIVAEQQSESPLMTHVRLDNVLMPEARKLEMKAEA